MRRTWKVNDVNGNDVDHDGVAPDYDYGIIRVECANKVDQMALIGDNV